MRHRFYADRTIPFSLIAVGVIAGVAALALGIYQRFAPPPRDELATSSRRLSTAGKSGAVKTSFVFHETEQVVPALAFLDGDGNEISLKDFYGRTILLNLWATWCVPCREEMPALDRLEYMIGGSTFEVVPLSIDRGGVPLVKAFYQEIGLSNLSVYVDTSGKAASGLGAVGIPTTLLINPKGREIGRVVGPAKWDSPKLVDVIRQKMVSVANKQKNPIIEGSARTPASGNRVK